MQLQETGKSGGSDARVVVATVVSQDAQDDEAVCSVFRGTERRLIRQHGHALALHQVCHVGIREGLLDLPDDRTATGVRVDGALEVPSRSHGRWMIS